MPWMAVVSSGMWTVLPLDAGVGGAVGHHLVEAYFDDVVVSDLHTGGFKVEEDDGFGEMELHDL